MKSSPKESAITAKVLKSFKSIGILAWKNHATMYSRAGIPDVQAVHNGMTYYIEMKRPGEETTAIQKAMHALLRKAGAPVLVAHSVEEAVGFVTSHGGTKIEEIRFSIEGKELSPLKLSEPFDQQEEYRNAFFRANARLENARAFIEEEAAIEKSKKGFDPRVPEDLACSNCGARSFDTPNCAACKAPLSFTTMGRRITLRKQLNRLDRLAKGPAGSLVRQFAKGKKKRGG